MSILIAILIIVAGVVLVGAVSSGIGLFTSKRARAVKVSEHSPRIVVTTELKTEHPEIVKDERLDRHDAYIWVHLGLWCIGMGILLSPGPAAAITALSWDAQKLLGTCMLTGSSVALIGLTLGLQLPGGRYLVRRVVDNLLAELLGDDIRIPYTFAVLGLLSVGVSMAGYGWTIYQYATVIGTLAGGLTFAIGGMCATLGVKFSRRILRYVRQRDALLTEIGIRIEENGS